MGGTELLNDPPPALENMNVYLYESRNIYKPR